MKIPSSMSASLQAWNQGKGIDLQSWIGCEGNFSLAVGYAALFWPRLVEFDGYVLHEGFSEESLRQFEQSGNGDRRGVEAVMNHRYISSLHHVGCEDETADKLLLLGEVLKEMYEAKLALQFPNRPCTVHFEVPEDTDDLLSYEVTFWQKAHESSDR